MNHKEEKKTSSGKSTGRSKTGKPLDQIDISPQQKVDDAKIQREGAVDLTPPPIEESRKALTIMQRQKRARVMRRLEPKLERARAIAKKRTASKQKLQVRAERAAREILKRRFSGMKGTPYAELSVAQKIQVDKKLEGKAALIKRLAARLLPKIRRKEFERLRSFYKGDQMKSMHSEKEPVSLNTATNHPMHEELNSQFQNLFNELLNKQDQTSIQQMVEEYTPETLVDIVEEMINELDNEHPFKGRLMEMLDNVAPKNPIYEALLNKAEKSGIDFAILEEVFKRGVEAWDGTRGTQQQFAFDRVNSYIAEGKAYELDKDLHEVGGAGDTGTTKLVKKYKKDTPCQKTNEMFEGYWKDIDTKKKEEERLKKEKELEKKEECWTGYTQKGMKKKGNKMVPNCVPVSEADLSPLQISRARARAKEAGRPYPNPIDDAWASKQISENDINEDLRKWFDQKWVRMDTKGKIKGDCAREEGEGKPKCLPLAKAKAMDKEDRAKAARRKRREDPVADREGKGNKPVFVKTEEVEHLDEKNAPTNPELWSKAKSLAKSKFDVYPSAYANGWAAKWYKSKGGGWKSVSEEKSTECAPGQYYCYEDKMCKPIPEGYKVGKDGMLVKEEIKFTMNESFMLDKVAGIGQTITAADAGIEIKAGFVNYPGVEELSSLLQMESVIKHRFNNFIDEGVDDEGAMAKSELMAMIKKAQSLASKMSSDKQLDGWVQSKITKAADYINSVHDFLMNNKQEVDK